MFINKLLKKKDYFENKTNEVDAREKIKINTRKYAKRHLTWFKKDKEIKTDNLSDHRLKSNGLMARSPLLSKALGELKDDESFQSELNKLFMKRRILEDIGKNEKSELVPGFEDLGDGTKIPVIKRIGEPKKEPRMFRPTGSTILTTKWVWLDFEEEWP